MSKYLSKTGIIYDSDNACFMASGLGKGGLFSKTFLIEAEFFHLLVKQIIGGGGLYS